MDQSNRMRRCLLLGVAALGVMGHPLAHAQSTPRVEVWKDPSCGCCKDWVLHLEKNGFSVFTFDTGNNAKRAQVGLDKKFSSCHTALVGGYVIEGHVPAADIQRLLKEKPKALGLAVPGMPIGSPGMDGAVYGGRKDPFDVLLVKKDGTSQVFKSYA